MLKANEVPSAKEYFFFIKSEIEEICVELRINLTPLICHLGANDLQG